MNKPPLSVVTVLSVVLLVSVVSGPLVSGVDLSPREYAAVGSGSATVTVESVPSNATLVATGNDTYRLEVPNATVTVDSLTGNPVLVYRIQIREIGLTRITTHFLNESRTGREELHLDPVATDLDDRSAEQFRGELRLILRGDDERLLYEGPVTVEVTE